MKVREYLNLKNIDELTRRLVYLDTVICDLHKKGYYMVMELADVEVFEEGITLASFNNRLDYINSGLNYNGHEENRDFLQLCVLGLCAYSGVTPLRMSREFIESVVADCNPKNGGISKYLSADMPEYMREYYKDVFTRNNLDSLTNFMDIYYKQDDGGLGYQKKLATQQGKEYAKALAEQNEKTGFASILLLPALLTLIYILAVVVYFIFIK